jgi:hypothetical protein
VQGLLLPEMLPLLLAMAYIYIKIILQK